MATIKEAGMALALSGGGFRAVLFHLGAFKRLNELELLSRLKAISAVSGGSIVLGVLATRWTKLQGDQNGRFTNFDELVIAPLIDFTSKSIDVSVIARGALNSFKTAGEELIECYRDELKLDALLSDLPAAPIFTFQATNYASGSAFRFSQAYCADYRIGKIESRHFDVATAIACSSAFPPVLAPIELKMNPSDFVKMEGAYLFDKDSYKKILPLADGGVYDNLALETIWDRYETVLVSDAGKPFEVEESLSSGPIAQLGRVREIGMGQALALRKRWLISSYQLKNTKGTYWGISTDIRNYEVADKFVVNPSKVNNLSQIRTRLNQFNNQEQGELINWGYAVCDAAVRTHISGEINVSHDKFWPQPPYSLS